MPFSFKMKHIGTHETYLVTSIKIVQQIYQKKKIVQQINPVLVLSLCKKKFHACANNFATNTNKSTFTK